MKKSLLFSLLLSTLLSSQSAVAAVRGRIVDGSGNPVADAMVVYTKVDNRLIFTYTCSDGKFSIVAPTDWTIKAPQIYTCGPTGTIPSGKTARTQVNNSMNLSVEGSMLRFYVSESQRISVALFASNGRKVQTVFNGTLKRGFYQVNPFSSVKSSLAHQVYVVQVSDGTATQSRTMVNTGIGGNAMMASVENGGQANALPKMLAAVDTIRAGKTGYTATKKGVDSYDVDVGDVTIAKRDIEAEVTALMNGKSTAWKAGQCTQGVDYNTGNGSWGTLFYGVGNGGEPAARATQSNGWQTSAKNSTGIGVMVGIDAVHGFISPPGATFFPHNIGMGCGRDTNLIELEERVTAIESRAAGVNWAFAPCMDVVRNERHGRTYEGWDEGPDGTKLCVRHAIRGFQGTDLSCDYTMAATAKHFAGAGGTVDGTHGGNTATATGANANNILCSIHLPGYKTAVDNGVATVMAGFNAWMGTAMHICTFLLTDTLKTRWNWDGFIVGDWMASNGAPGGIPASFAAGVDNPMNPDNPNAAFNAIQGAQQARLDDGCKRILRTKLRMNLQADPMARTYLQSTIKSDLHKQVSRECVRRSMVLLKNDEVSAGKKVLPIATTAKVHIIGSFADDMWMQCGGWTLGWPSAYYNNPRPAPPAGTTLKAAIQAACPGATFAADANNIPAAAEVLVVCVGELPYAEGGGDAPNNQPITLTNAHKGLITTAAASNKPVVVVMYTGRPLIITDDIAKVKGWMVAWLPGTEGGGMADILFAVNGEKPTAKLSHTWPAAYDQIPVNTPNPATGQPYGDFVGSGGTPLFNYGSGLTY
jgi:beta-glucosidase